jgi:hypothetical protein
MLSVEILAVPQKIGARGGEDTAATSAAFTSVGDRRTDERQAEQDGGCVWETPVDLHASLLGAVVGVSLTT